MRLHLIDATYELFRAYFGWSSITSPDGREVAAVRGLIESTLGLLRQPGVTHVAAATDSVIRSFRNDLYDGYKTEEGMEPELWAQFPLAERALEAIGVVVWPMKKYEADDALATAAARFASEVEQVVILSPDKDFAQCVSGRHIVLYDRRRRLLIDEKGVREKFGVGPGSIPDYLALVGDNADGLRGVPGWGAKSASTLLARYQSLERIPVEHVLWDVKVRGAERLGTNLRKNLGQALFERYLAVLRRDVPLRESLEELRWKGAPRKQFEQLCDELGFVEARDKPHAWV